MYLRIHCQPEQLLACPQWSVIEEMLFCLVCLWQLVMKFPYILSLVVVRVEECLEPCENVVQLLALVVVAPRPHCHHLFPEVCGVCARFGIYVACSMVLCNTSSLLVPLAAGFHRASRLWLGYNRSRL